MVTPLDGFLNRLDGAVGRSWSLGGQDSNPL